MCVVVVSYQEYSLTLTKFFALAFDVMKQALGGYTHIALGPTAILNSLSLLLTALDVDLRCEVGKVSLISPHTQSGWWGKGGQPRTRMSERVFLRVGPSPRGARDQLSRFQRRRLEHLECSH